MTRTQGAIALLLLAAISVGGWMATRAAQEPAHPGNPKPAAENTEEPSHPTPQAPNATRATPLPPMPLTGVALRDALPSLQTRADGGDGKAACRLAMELLRCREMAEVDPAKDRQIEAQLEQRPAGPGDGLAEMMERQLTVHRAVRAACAGLPAGIEDRAGNYLRIAALAGEPEALFRYAVGEGFNTRRGYGFIRTPQFDQWRHEAPALMERALAGGDARAALALHDAQANDAGLFAGLVAGTPSDAAAYRLLAQSLFGESLQLLEQPLLPGFAAETPGPDQAPVLPAEQAQRAATQAASWHRDYFQGRRFELLDLMLDSSLLPMDRDAEQVLATDFCATDGR
jgi:hypothetical protein